MPHKQLIIFMHLKFSTLSGIRICKPDGRVGFQAMHVIHSHDVGE